MSTRATYVIDGHGFYIHTDGYPEHAALYFLNMVKANAVEIKSHPQIKHEYMNRPRGGYAAHFLRGNCLAEFTEGHDAHGDTEYQYTMDGAGHLTVYGVKENETATGLVSDFINRHHKEINSYYGGDFEPVTHYTPEYGGVEYYTVSQCVVLSEYYREQAQRFAASNPNYESSIKLARTFSELARVALDEFSELKQPTLKPVPKPTPIHNPLLHFKATQAPTPSIVASVTLNPEKNGVEIAFDEKPPFELRTRLMDGGFNYSGRQGLWYAKQCTATLALADQVATECAGVSNVV